MTGRQERGPDHGSAGGNLATLLRQYFQSGATESAGHEVRKCPAKYWRNLPEASLIKPLIEGAGCTASAMIAKAASEPHKSEAAGSA